MNSTAPHIVKCSQAIQPVIRQCRSRFFGALRPIGSLAPEFMAIRAPIVESEALSGIENIESHPNATLARAHIRVAHSHRSPALWSREKRRSVQAEA